MTTALRNSALVIMSLALAACSVESHHSEEDVNEATEAVTNVCPTTSVKGIDVASFQHPGGAAINWTKVATAEKFAIVKATEKNNYVNSYYADDIQKARAAGLVAGSYHFLAPSSQTGVSGAAQAQYFLAHASIKAEDLPPMLDVETSPSYNSVLPSVNDVKGWLTAVEAAVGRKPIVYIGYYVIGDLGTPAVLKTYPINVPSYGACPNFPDSYPIDNLVMWQHTSTATVPGITGGGVDEDKFYGNMTAFLAFAHGTPATNGSLDQADCTGIKGWGYDPAQIDKPIDVDLSFDGAKSDTNATTVRLTADETRMDLCTSIGSCDHAFSMNAPRSLFDGASHDVHGYSVDSMGNAAAELDTSPKTLQCPALDIPSGTVKRLVDDASFAAWSFDAFIDVAPIGESEIDAEPDGAPVPAAPECVKADDGTPEVWVIDQGYRRHVLNKASLAAWRLTSTVTPAATVYANAIGPDWPATPDLVQGSGSQIYVLDSPMGHTTVDPGATGSTGGGAAGPGNGDDKKPAGCAVTMDGTNPTTGALLVLAALLAMSRRRGAPPSNVPSGGSATSVSP